MNAPVDVERMELVLGLREWAGRCREVPARRLPRLILDVCQALYDAALPGRPPVARKRAVFESVAAGDYRGAIMAMVPAGFEISTGESGAARLFDPVTGLDACSTGPDADHALLACLAELALSLGDAERERVYA